MPSQATRPPLVGMPAVWLRDNCPCPLCRDPVSGQRLLHITDIPADITVAEVVALGRHRVGAVPPRWPPGRVRPGLAGPPRPRRAGAGPRTRAPRTPSGCGPRLTWAASRPRGSWPRYLAEAGYRRACQSAILREGLLLLSDVPTDPGAVLAVAASLGYVRETNYGRLFDVRAESSPSNLAFTSLPIPPHTDNPYRDPVPTVQLLHCLHNAADGGDSGFVDGFRAAAALRAQDPAAFATLAVTPVTFGYRDAGHGAVRHPAADQPGRRGAGSGRSGSTRAASSPSGYPGRRPRPSTPRTARSRSCFPPRRRCSPCALRPGDCAVFDNTRVLHARTGFARAGRRHLQGCYADLDGVESAVAVGERATTGVSRRKDRI